MPILRLARSDQTAEGEQLVVRELPKDVHSTNGHAPGKVQDPDAQGAAGHAAPGHSYPTGSQAEDQPPSGFLSAAKAGQDRNLSAPPATKTQAAIVVPECYRQDALVYFIEELLAGRTFVEICGEEDMPTIGIIRQWISRDPRLPAGVHRSAESDCPHVRGGNDRHCR